MKNDKMKILSSLLVAYLCIGVVNAGWTKSVDDKIKEVIDDIADTLKNGVDRIGDDLAHAQGYLDDYAWKGIIQDEVTSGAVTLKYLQLNSHSKAVIVSPGERVTGTVLCNLDPEKCSYLKFYRVLLGFNGKGAQVAIGNELGIVAGESLESFVLIAPSEPGIYQIRFKLVSNLSKNAALEAWVDENGSEPSANTTIGIVVVK